MLPSLQYTDFHKFVVSVGGLACAVGLGLPVLLLGNQPVLQISQTKLRELTPESQRAVRAQQSQAAWLLHTWPYWSASLILIGAVLVSIGAVMWKRHQDQIDTREVAEISKIHAEREKTYHETLALLRVHQESPEEVVEAHKEKGNDFLPAADEVQDAKVDPGVGETREQKVDPGMGETTEERVAPEVDEARETKADSDQATPAPGATDWREGSELAVTDAMPSLIRRAANIATARNRNINWHAYHAEKRVIDSFKMAFGDRIDIVPEVRLGHSHADAAITSRDPNIPNLLLDIRYIHSATLGKNLRNRVNEMLAWSMRVRRSAKATLGVEFLPVAFFIVDDDDDQLFPDKMQDPVSDQAINIVMEAIEDLGEQDVPLTIAISTTSSINPHTLQSVRWHPNRIQALIFPR